MISGNLVFLSKEDCKKYLDEVEKNSTEYDNDFMATFPDDSFIGFPEIYQLRSVERKFNTTDVSLIKKWFEFERKYIGRSGAVVRSFTIQRSVSDRFLKSV